MEMFYRTMSSILQERLTQFPVVALTGPRQSGKTTLLEHILGDYTYINLESPEQLERVQLDPKGALSQTKGRGVIIDEAQRFPNIFSYIQVISDQAKQKGQFILSGSQNFLLNQQITQSLAGRAAILELLPLTYSEYLTHSKFSPISLWSWLYQGAYPRPYQNNIPTNVWMDSYVRTYLERDVRDLLKIKDLSLFQKFLRLCAGRHGQILNMNQLSVDAGVSHTTINHWLSVLEASYLIFRLQPYYSNFNKRVIKSPKLYFYDSGLVCYLLGIASSDQLSIHASRGAIFEGYVISELKKYFSNFGLSQQFYFWRDNHGNEIDCVFDYGGNSYAIEIKSTSTFRKELLKTLQKWQTISGMQRDSCKLIYSGEEDFNVAGIDIIRWQNIVNLIATPG